MSASPLGLRADGQPPALDARAHTLGYPLFRRRAFGTTLTARGTHLVASARKMAEWAGEIGRAAEKHEQRPTGLVRIAAAPFTAGHLLAPFAATLKTKESGIRLEVLSAVELLDLARGEADLALRSRPPTSEDLVVVASFPFRRVVYASRAYAQRLPKRYTFADVAWIGYAPPSEPRAADPRLGSPAPDVMPTFTSNSFLVQVRAVEAGVGAMALRLDLGPHAHDVMHLIAAKSAHEIPRIRRTAEVLVKELQRQTRL